MAGVNSEGVFIFIWLGFEFEFMGITFVSCAEIFQEKVKAASKANISHTTVAASRQSVALFGTIMAASDETPLQCEVAFEATTARWKTGIADRRRDRFTPP
jgi:hypothetical protein